MTAPAYERPRDGLKVGAYYRVVAGTERDARYYTVSAAGEVFSVGRSRCTQMKAHPNAEGYPKVWIRYADGKRRSKFVHRLVAEAFLRPPRSKAARYVLHADGDRTNNRATNLRWGTHAENHADKVRAGTSRRRAARRLSDATVATIREATGTPRQIADAHGVSLSHVRDLRSGRRRAA